MKINRHTPLLLSALVLLITCGTFRSVDGQGLPMDPKIVKGTLENGLTYYIRANKKPENRAALRLAVNTGSIMEDDDQQGLAHFLEHMAFNGTEHFEKQELVDFLEGIGMRFGPDLNAYTSFDETVYMLEIPLDDEEIIEKSFLILQDWAQGISFDAEEIEKERGVVTEEWRLGQGAQQRVLDKQLPAMLHDSRYAERLPIGKVEIIGSAPREAFTRYYNNWYRPDLMAVAVVGDFEISKMEALVRKYFSPLKNPENPPARPEHPVPGHEETLFSIVTDPELSYTRLEIIYKRDAEETTTVEAYRKSIVDSIYESMLNERLSERLQEPNPPYLGAGVGSQTLVRPTEIFAQIAVAKEGQLSEALTALLVEARRVKRDGFTEGELERTKADILRRYEQAYNERDKTQSASYADEYIRNFLEKEPIPGIEVELEIVREALPGITLAEVNSVAQEVITDENRVILYSAPEKEGLAVPTEADILAVMAEAEEATIEAYDDGVSDAPLIAQLPQPGEVVAEQRYERIETTEWRLSNGIRVLLKPTDFKNDQVILRGFSPGGHSLYEDRDFVAASTAAQVVAQGGLGDFDIIELQKRLAGKIARASVNIDSLTESVSAFAAPQDLELMFQLLYLKFTAPRSDENAFQSMKTRMLDILRNRENDPQSVFADRVQKFFYRDHPRHQPMSKELVEKMDLDRSMQVYRDRLANAGDFTFVIVGNFDADEIRPLVERYLGGLPVIDRVEEGVFRGDDPLRGEQKLTVRKGLEPKTTVQINFTGDHPWNNEDRYALRAAVDVLKIRLREELREDMGGVYGVSVWGSTDRWPKGTYSSGISFGCDPGKADALIEAALGEVKRLQQNGASEVNLAKVREQHERWFELNLKENGFWVGNLMFRAQYGLDLEGLLDFPEYPENLSSDDVQSAAKKYFSWDNVFTTRLEPEKTEE